MHPAGISGPRRARAPDTASSETPSLPAEAPAQTAAATTQRRLEAYFRREWSYAIDRARNIAEGALFIMPVTIDDTDGGNAQVPEKFKAVHFTRLIGGEVTPQFAERLKDLLAARHG